VPNEEVWSWLSRQLADAVMLVLAMHQAADAARAVRDQATDDAAPEIDKAIARFNAACPDRRVLRDAIPHHADYQRGAGHRQTDTTSPEPSYGLTDDFDTFYYSIGNGRQRLEMGLGEAFTAASILDRAVRDALTEAMARRGGTSQLASGGRDG
jgi:hypothetical protein